MDLNNLVLYQVVIHNFDWIYHGEGTLNDIDVKSFNIDSIMFETEESYKEFLSDGDGDYEYRETDDSIEFRNGKKLDEYEDIVFEKAYEKGDYEQGDGDWENVAVFVNYLEACKHRDELVIKFENLCQKHQPHNLPDWVENAYEVSNQYPINVKTQIEAVGMFDNPYDLAGTEVYCFLRISEIINVIKDWLKWDDFVHITYLSNNEGYANFDLPKIQSSYTYINELSLADGILLEDDEEIYNNLGSKYEIDPVILNFYNIRKDLKLPKREDFLENNKERIELINKYLIWFEKHNFAAFQRIVYKLHHFNTCIWNYYPSLLKELREYKMFYESGNIKELIQLKNSISWNGSYKWFHENGSVMREVFYKDGVQQDGPVDTYDDKGNKIRSVNIIDNKFEGYVREWWENGRLKSEEKWKNNKQIGSTRYWDEDGNEKK